MSPTSDPTILEHAAYIVSAYEGDERKALGEVRSYRGFARQRYEQDHQDPGLYQQALDRYDAMEIEVRRLLEEYSSAESKAPSESPAQAAT